MAALTIQTISLTGVAITLAAAGASGDTFVNDGRTYLRAKNSHATLSRTVTIDSKSNCSQGFDHNVAVVVAALTELAIGPFSQSRFGSTSDVTYSDSGADVTVAAVKLPAS